MAYSHEARTLLREPVNTDFGCLRGLYFGMWRQLLFIVWRSSGFDFADRCFVGGALNGLATFLGGGLRFAGLTVATTCPLPALSRNRYLPARKKLTGASVVGRPGSW